MGIIFKGLYFLIRLIIVLLGIFGVLIVARLVLLFFGSLKSLPGYQFVINITNLIISPFKIAEVISTPYAGYFDLTAVIILILLIIAEYGLGIFEGIIGRMVRPSQQNKRLPQEEEIKKAIEKPLPVERSITIYLNGVELLTIQATPENLDELAVGFLYSEGLLKDRGSLKEVQIGPNKDSVRVETTPIPEIEDLLHNITLTSGCGKGIIFGGWKNIPISRLKTTFRVTSETILNLMSQLLQQATLYHQTGGIHASALADKKRILCIREDIARHNTFDKLLGKAFLDGTDTSQTSILTTGRISSEMAMKAARADIPIVISRTGVTDLAVSLAEEIGLTIIGYVRAGKMNIYTHPERIG